MTPELRTVACAAIALAICLARADAADLTSVKALYASAAYEEALASLASTDGSDQPELVEQYRALCLIALGRTEDAERSLERIVAVSPMYRLPENEVSPRLVDLFQAARKRALPRAAKGRYAQAKADFEAGRYAAAVRGFRLVLEIVGDGDAAGESLADLRQLADGFLKLSETALSPAPAPSAPDASPPLQAPSSYTESDSAVTPPVELERQMPSYSPGPQLATRQFSGTLAVTIDEQGRVESAEVAKPTLPTYDAALLRAVRSWRYRPATKDGLPVKYRKVYQIVLSPASTR